MFRTPTDLPDRGVSFYNEDYAQGFTTDLPSPAELDRLKQTRFAGTEKDYSRFVQLFKDLGVPEGGRIFDFGCSWGYGSYQFAEAGFDIRSYEISKPRGSYGSKNLGVRLVDDFMDWANSSEAKSSQDVFFSSHVLEHVPSPSTILTLACRVLKPGGLLISFTPNGSAAAKIDPSWNKQWGDVHPNFLDDVFWDHALNDHPRIMLSSSYEIDENARAALSKATTSSYKLDELAASELGCIARVGTVQSG